MGFSFGCLPASPFNPTTQRPTPPPRQRNTKAGSFTEGAVKMTSEAKRKQININTWSCHKAREFYYHAVSKFRPRWRSSNQHCGPPPLASSSGELERQRLGGYLGRAVSAGACLAPGGISVNASVWDGKPLWRGLLPGQGVLWACWAGLQGRVGPR